MAYNITIFSARCVLVTSYFDLSSHKEGVIANSGKVGHKHNTDTHTQTHIYTHTHTHTHTHTNASGKEPG